MTRRVFSFASALSLLLCVAAITFWPRAGKFGDTLAYTTASDARYSVGTAPGHVALGFVSHTPPMAPGHGWSASSVRWGTPERVTALVSPPTPPMVTTITVERKWYPPAHQFLGLGWQSVTASLGPPFSPRPVTLRSTLLAVPFWPIVLLTAVLPAVWLAGRLRSRARRRRGHCVACGYDLRASTNCCPECGRPVPAGVQTTPAAGD